MAFSSGTFSRLYDWETDRDGGVKIRADRMDAEMDGFATGLSTCLLKDGTQTVTADIPMSNQKFTGLSAGSAVGHSVRWEQVFKLHKGADVASAADLDLGADGNSFDVTGTTTVTSIDTTSTNQQVGSIVLIQFDGALTLTHHATDLILPGGANITTAAGDCAFFQKYDTGDWRCVMYQKANGEAVVQYSDPMTTRGDILRRGASTTERLAIGSANTVLSSDGTDPSWGSVTGPMLVVGSDARGDILARGASNYDRLAIGGANTVLGSDGTDPSWGKVSGPMIAMGSDAQGDTLYHNGTNYVRLAKGTASQLLTMNAGATAPEWASAAVAAATGFASLQVFTTSGTWTRPTDITRVLMFVQGGGGAGGSTSAGPVDGCGGGGAGGLAIKTLDVSAIASSTITVGAAASASSWADGSNTVTGNGGSGGSGGSTSGGNGGAGGTATGGDVNLTGSTGNCGIGRIGSTDLEANGGTGGSGIFGTGAGRGSVGPVAGQAAAANTGAGGGGAGKHGPYSGGAGATGIVIVLEFK